MFSAWCPNFRQLFYNQEKLPLLPEISEMQEKASEESKIPLATKLIVYEEEEYKLIRTDQPPLKNVEEKEM
jgi:hypothetical protein